MTRDDIIRMAREAGISQSHAEGMTDFLEHFAALVAAAEREACAKVCENTVMELSATHSEEEAYGAYMCSRAICARSQE